MGPGDLAVGEVHVFQVGEVGVARVLAVVHVVLDVDDDRVFQDGGVVVLLGAGGGGAVPLDLDLGQALAGGQGGQQQRRGLVEDLGDDHRLVHALAGRLAGLRVARDDHFVVEALDHHLVLVAFLVGVADRILGEGAGGDQALLGAGDGHIGGGCHGWLALDELRRSASWLGARLRRAGVEHGMAFALDLQAGDEGLLLVASDTPQSAALDWLGLLLAPLLAAARGVTRAAPFLAADPQPALLLDGEAQAVEFNQAFLALLGERPREAWRAYLPANHGQLVRASLGQARALGEVEAECDGRILLWQFIPDSAEARVLARCRDATASRGNAPGHRGSVATAGNRAGGRSAPERCRAGWPDGLRRHSARGSP